PSPEVARPYTNTSRRATIHAPEHRCSLLTLFIERGEVPAIVSFQGVNASLAPRRCCRPLSQRLPVHLAGRSFGQVREKPDRLRHLISRDPLPQEPLQIHFR